MQRRPTTQDITWLLDLDRNKQLDLNPPYQRKSVWTRADKQFFLDTIFRNYPSPSIFLHKDVDETGQSKYHVVDGKQRTQTILEFVNDKLKMPSNYGDVRLDGKYWKDLAGEIELRRRFWNYQITVEIIDFDEVNLVNTVFDRLNRNAKRLTDQELRHAQFSGWFIQQVETEVERPEWRDLSIVTNARSKRMADAQFMSELMLVLLEQRALGFDQDALSNLYAKYDDLSDLEEPVDPDDFRARFDELKAVLFEMEQVNGCISVAAKALLHIYSLWTYLALTPQLPAVEELAQRFLQLFETLELLSNQPDVGAYLQDNSTPENQRAFRYMSASRGANTDAGPREIRLSVLRELFGP